MRSLRSTILIGLGLLLTIVGILASALTYRLTAYEAGQFMDDQMRQLAVIVDERTHFSVISALQEPEDRFAVSVWQRDGQRVVLAPPNLPRMPQKAGFANIQFEGAEWRTFSAGQPSGWVVVAQLLSARGEIAAHAAIEVALPLIAMIPLAWIIVQLSVGRMLGRLTEVGEMVAAPGIRLESPVPTSGLPSEVQPFVAAINRLLARVNASLEQQRRFIADSAHHLRTPLAALTLQVENLRALKAGHTEVDSLKEGAARVAILLDQLLFVARFEAGAVAGSPEQLDLADELRQCIAEQFDIAQNAKVDLGIVQTEEARVTMARTDLHILLSNLLDNAIRYTPADGRVDCAISRSSAGEPMISVADSGPGVRKEDLPRLTDRFFRASDAQGNGSGLGLAIVKAIADRYRLNLEFKPSSTGGLSAVLTFLDSDRPFL